MLISQTVTTEIERQYGPDIVRAKNWYQLGVNVLFEIHETGKTDRESWLVWLFLSRATMALRSVLNLFCLGSDTDANSVFRTWSCPRRTGHAESLRKVRQDTPISNFMPHVVGAMVLPPRTVRIPASDFVEATSAVIAFEYPQHGDVESLGEQIAHCV